MMSQEKDRTPEQEEALAKANEAVKKYAEKHRREHAERVPDTDEPNGVLAGSPEYLDADLDDENG